MIGCTGLGKRYGDRWLFRALDIQVQPGDCLIVRGANGSGKSTLLKVLAGFVPGSEGQVQRPQDVHRSLGFAALDQNVYPHLTVGEHMELAARMRGVEPRTDELLESLGLAYAKAAMGSTLSTGMRSRLKLALAVQPRPSVLIVDEPGAGLDEDGRARLEAVVQQVRPQTAIIAATNEAFERRWATLELELEN